MGQGIRISSEDQPLILNVKDHGDIIQRRWFAIGVVGYGPIVSRWNETDSDTNGIATATHAAAVGFTHHVVHVSGGYESIVAAGNLVLNDGVIVVHEWGVQLSFSPNFGQPDDMTEGALTEAVLSAGGVGVVGHVNIGGYTTLGGLDFGTVKTYEGIYSMRENLQIV